MTAPKIKTCFFNYLKKVDINQKISPPQLPLHYSTLVLISIHITHSPKTWSTLKQNCNFFLYWAVLPSGREVVTRCGKPPE